MKRLYPEIPFNPGLSFNVQPQGRFPAVFLYVHISDGYMNIRESGNPAGLTGSSAFLLQKYTQLQKRTDG